MNDQRQLPSHAVPTAFLFLLIGLFALSSLTLTLIGTRVYRRVSDTAALTADAQTALSYLCNKVRAYDVTGGVRIGERGGAPALLLDETLEGEPYETSIYVYGGALREWFGPRGEAFEPGDGESLMAADALSLAPVSPALLQVSVAMPDGETHTLRVALRAGTVEEANGTHE